MIKHILAFCLLASSAFAVGPISGGSSSTFNGGTITNPVAITNSGKTSNAADLLLRGINAEPGKGHFDIDYQLYTEFVGYITAASKSGNNITLTFLGTNGEFQVGDSITVAGTASSTNNGTFTITAYSGQTVTYVNASGVTNASETGTMRNNTAPRNANGATQWDPTAGFGWNLQGNANYVSGDDSFGLRFEKSYTTSGGVRQGEFYIVAASADGVFNRRMVAVTPRYESHTSEVDIASDSFKVGQSEDNYWWNISSSGPTTGTQQFGGTSFISFAQNRFGENGATADFITRSGSINLLGVNSDSSIGRVMAGIVSTSIGSDQIQNNADITLFYGSGSVAGNAGGGGAIRWRNSTGHFELKQTANGGYWVEMFDPAIRVDKDAVVAVATSNITSKSGVAQTVDGVALTNGLRVLLTAQTTASENGPWVVASGSWTRPSDYSNDSNARIRNGALVYVLSGTANANTFWSETTSSVFVDHDDTTWKQVTCRQLSGTGTPESVITAPIGAIYTRKDGGAGTTLYVKESGAGNTGWVAK